MYEELLASLMTEWSDRIPPEDLVERDIEFDPKMVWGSPRKIVSIVGLRRVGKTYFLFQLSRHAADNGYDIVYLNFEDERIPPDSHVLSDLIATIKEKYSTLNNLVLLLDEIHRIPEWSRWLRRVYDLEKPAIVITGSTSKLTELSLPYELRGRTIIMRVFPLRFSEYLRFKGIKIEYPITPYVESERARLMALFKEYLEYGGLPEVALSSPAKRIMILQDYFNTIVLKDIIERKGDVRDISKAITLIKLMVNTTYYSTTKLEHTMRSLGYKTSRDTIIEYKNLAQQAFFIETIPQMTNSLKKQIIGPQKLYVADTGFITTLSRKRAHLGRLLENLVYTELRRRYYGQPTIEISYWQNKTYEVDFVVRDGFEILDLIQVCWDPTDYETRIREIEGLKRLMRVTGAKIGTIVTGNYRETLKVGSKTIRFIPYWQWEAEKRKSHNAI